MKMLTWDKETLGLKYSSQEIPSDLRDAAQQARHNLLEHIAEYDDEIMMNYLENGDLSVKEVFSAIRCGVLHHQFVPVLCGSALKNIGIQILLDAVTDFLPSPLDVPPAEAHDSKDQEVHLIPDSKEPFIALVFKVQIDKYLGKLIYTRVYSGTIKKGQTIVNQTTGKKVRISRLLQMHSNKKKDVDELQAGDLGAIVGARELKTGDTITAIGKNLLMEDITFPDSVIAIAIEPRTKADQEALSDALFKLEEEDPTFHVTQNKDTGQTLLTGMGELHLEIIVDRLKREFNVNANVGSPQVSYKETIEKPVLAHGEFIREMNGKGHYAIVDLRLSPIDPDKLLPLQKNTFENHVTDSIIPSAYWQSIQESSLNALLDGPLLSAPVERIKIELIGGKFHEVDSSETAFNIASSMAINYGLHSAISIIMEPIMLVSVITPEVSTGDIIGDISAKRGKIENIIAMKNEKQEIVAEIPMSELFSYSTRLRSLSQGRAIYTMEFFKYDRVPTQLQEKILKKMRGY